MTSNNHINVPIIPYGLRQEETIVQIASALDTIDGLVNDVFQQIENSILKNRQYLADLKQRSEIVAIKVGKLTGKNVATTVYSDHKFPLGSTSIKALSDDSLRPSEKKTNIYIESKFQHVKYSKSLTKLHFFHVKWEDKSDEEELILEKGLGRIPVDVDCVSSLLLFNTAENLYQKYVFVDPLAINNKVKLMPEEKKKNIAAAPTSILADQVFDNKDYDGSFYSPPFVEVPSFNVPLDLPDLPGIAGDLKYNYGNELSTCPMKQSESTQDPEKSKSIEEITATDLPIITPCKKTKTSIIENAENSVASQSNNPSQQITIPPPPPPLPSLDLSIPPLPSPIENLKTPTGNQTVMSNIEGTRKTPALPKPSTNMHATLMEAIRNAGGKEKAKLRPIREQADINFKSSNSNSNANNQFLDELYRNLAIRRKGISGHDKGGIMSRVRELISQSSDSNDNSEDSECSNDWDDS